LPSSSHPPIRLGAPGEEIHRKHFGILARRFLHLHRQRLEKLHKCLNRRQRDSLDILPLLFHHNHPALPGFCGGLPPFGICDYRASASARQAIKRIAPGFDYRRRGNPEAPILALFLMGSVGSVAWSDNSDLDLWVCHRGDLDAEALQLLESKCREIECWAEGQGLEIHCFLIEPDAFREGRLSPLSGESSGSTQHILLLEEFYRSAIHLAGRRLLWWLVPPEQEHRYREYAAYLQDKRFIDPSSFIDLGGLENVPPAEFVSAGMWHLYKALNSPYKALLKLQLLLSYAAEYPRPDWIASRIKQDIYAGRLEESRFDPYIRLYEKVERFLAGRQKQDLLGLVRRGFAIKTRHALHHPHLRPQLESLLRGWGWDTPRRGAYQPYPPSFDALRKEWYTLIQALEQSYRTLRRFHYRHAAGQGGNLEELRTLGRKLNAVLEKRPGKVEIIHLTTPVDLSEMNLLIAGDGGPGSPARWILRRGQDQESPAIFQARYLTELLAWTHANHLAGPATHWDVLPETTPLQPAELRFLNQRVRRFLPAVSNGGMDAYRARAKLKSVALFPNIAHSGRPRRANHEIASEHFDPLAYGADRQVLVRFMETLSLNSWGELQVRRHEGLEGLFDCLCLLFDQAGPALHLEAHCFTSRTIALRIVELYQTLAQAMDRDGNTRFVLSAGHTFYLFQRQNGSLNWWEVGGKKALLEHLGQPRANFSPVVFDRHLREDPLLPFLYRHNRADTLQLFLHPLKEGAEVFLLDERGALFHQRHPHAPFPSTAQRYVSLLGALDRRGGTRQPLELYRLKQNGRKWEKHPLESEVISDPVIDVRVYAENHPGAGVSYTIVCDGKEFRSEEWKQEVFAEAAAYIRRLRRSGTAYPVYVSDIDVPAEILGLPSPTMIHTVPLLQYKRRIEQRLNQA